MKCQSIGGKVGEWIQGIDQAGEPIVCPLTVTRSFFKTRTVVARSDSLSVLSSPETAKDHTKTRRAVLALAHRYGFADDCNYRIVIRGSPPRGKGLGSSSIDIASTLLAIRERRALNVSEADLYKIMCSVERSDYLFDPPSIVAANPLDGSHAFIARAPQCSIFAWDTEPGRCVETEAVQYLDCGRRPFEREYRELFAMIETGETSLILQAATRSAEVNNRLLPKVGFERAHRLVKELPALGLVAAHTGTWLGFILPHPTDQNVLRRVSEFFAESLRRKSTRFEVGGEVGSD